MKIDPNPSPSQHRSERKSLRMCWWHNARLDSSEDLRREREQVKDLLKSLKTRHGIDCAIVSEWTDGDERDTYNQVFLHYRNRLRKNSGRPVTDLKSNTGNILLHNVIAFFDTGETIFFSRIPKAVSLLRGMLDTGGAHLAVEIDQNRRSETSGPKDSESRLVEDFLKEKNKLGFCGKVRTEVPLHQPAFEDDTFLKSFSYVRQKSVDLVHDRPDGSYDIIEAKKRLNWTAFGQALSYAFLYAKLNRVNETSVHPVVICRQIDEMVRDVCKRYGVAVILVGRSD